MKNTSTPKFLQIKSRKPLHDKLPVNSSLTVNDCSDIPIAEAMNKSPQLSPEGPRDNHRRRRTSSLRTSVPPSGSDESEYTSENESEEGISGGEDVVLEAHTTRQFPYVSDDDPPIIQFKRVPKQPIDDTTKPINNENSSQLWILVTILAFVFIAVTLAFIPSEVLTGNTSEKEMLERIKEKHSSQKDDLWIALESGLNDVQQFNHPVSFILLYTNDSYKTLRELLEDISKLVLCRISTCGNKAIILEDELNSEAVLQDYGILIEKYRKPLEKNGLMIVKNLENVPGKSAQVFHSFCDQVSPLVGKSIFIFTMKVKEFQGDQNLNFVEEELRKQWSDIKTDHFHPLFTRISNVVVEIVP